MLPCADERMQTNETWGKIWGVRRRRLINTCSQRRSSSHSTEISRRARARIFSFSNAEAFICSLLFSFAKCFFFYVFVVAVVVDAVVIVGYLSLARLWKTVFLDQSVAHVQSVALVDQHSHKLSCSHSRSTHSKSLRVWQRPLLLVHMWLSHNLTYQIRCSASKITWWRNRSDSVHTTHSM